MTIHAFTAHAGSSIFVNVNDLNMYIISMPKITVLSITLYMDKFGQGVQDLLKESREKLYSLDFNTMMLNAEGMKEIADIIS